MGLTDEIKKLEDRLREAELGPDPKFFETVLDDNAIIDGEKLKAKVVAAHQPNSNAPKFTDVKMSEYKITEHAPNIVVVTCVGEFASAKWSGRMKFMRVWMKTGAEWRIVAASTNHENQAH